jgi:hypothetical protein
LVALLPVKVGRDRPRTVAGVRVDNPDDLAFILSARPLLRVDAKMFGWVWMAVCHRDVTQSLAGLNDQAATLARGLLQRMRPDSGHNRFIHVEPIEI